MKKSEQSGLVLIQVCLTIEDVVRNLGSTKKNWGLILAPSSVNLSAQRFLQDCALDNKVYIDHIFVIFRKLKQK